MDTISKLRHTMSDTKKVEQAIVDFVIPFRTTREPADAKSFFIRAIQNCGCVAIATEPRFWRSSGEKGRVDWAIL
jgi:hypothetical protein